MRIISLVPSWTETLIESGIYPIGRTRFCVHPKGTVDKIPIVGGTKVANWELIKQLKPELIILDQEENPKDFSEKGFKFWASHVTDGKSLEKSLRELSGLLKNNQLMDLAQQCGIINQTPALVHPDLKSALIQVVKPWRGSEEVAYMIWKKPWMSISEDTYIAFVLQKIGFKMHNWKSSAAKYPVVEIDPAQGLIFLFSSEPYPFLKNIDEIKNMDVKSAIVDGEQLSWFGIRSLRFLQKALEISDHQ